MGKLATLTYWKGHYQKGRKYKRTQQ